MWSTPAVWKQYNKKAVLHFFPVNSSLYTLFSMTIGDKKRFEWKEMEKEAGGAGGE